MSLNSYCPVCQCLILRSGFCRNKDCKFSNKYPASAMQITRIYDLSEELGIPLTEYDYKKITESQAGTMIKKLLLKKAIKQATEMGL